MADMFGTFHRVPADQAAVIGCIAENHEIPNSAGDGDPLKDLAGAERGEATC